MHYRSLLPTSSACSGVGESLLPFHCEAQEKNSMTQEALKEHTPDTQEVDPERDPERVEALCRQIDFFLASYRETRGFVFAEGPTIQELIQARNFFAQWTTAEWFASGEYEPVGGRPAHYAALTEEEQTSLGYQWERHDFEQSFGTAEAIPWKE